MRDILSHLRRLPLFPLFSGLSLAIGFIIPSVYERLQNPAARSRHSGLELCSLIALAVGIFYCWLAVWLRRRKSDTTAEPAATSKLQFGIRDVFIGTTIVAVLLAIAPFVSPEIAMIFVIATVLGMFGWGVTCDWRTRSRIGVILSNTFLPFIWMVAFNVPIGRTSGLLSAMPFAPGLLIAELLRAFTQMSRDNSTKVAVAIVVVQLLLGAWLARRPGIAFIVYAIVILVLSSFSSLGMHALYRA